MRYGLLALTVAATLVFPGCSRSSTATGAGAAATPAQTVENLHRAMAQGDAAGAIACFRVEDAKNPAIVASFDFIAASVEFHDRFIEIYGEREWQRFNGGEGFTISLPTLSKAEDFTVQIEGDRALCYGPGETKPGALLRENGKWYVSADSLVPTGDPAKNLTDRMTAMARLLRTYEDKLGLSVDPGQLDTEMGDQLYRIIRKY